MNLINKFNKVNYKVKYVIKLVLILKINLCKTIKFLKMIFRGIIHSLCLLANLLYILSN